MEKISGRGVWKRKIIGNGRLMEVVEVQKKKKREVEEDTEEGEVEVDDLEE